MQERLYEMVAAQGIQKLVPVDIFNRLIESMLSNSIKKGSFRFIFALGPHSIRKFERCIVSESIATVKKQFVTIFRNKHLQDLYQVRQKMQCDILHLYWKNVYLAIHNCRVSLQQFQNVRLTLFLLQGESF